MKTWTSFARANGVSFVDFYWSRRVDFLFETNSSWTSSISSRNFFGFISDDTSLVYPLANSWEDIITFLYRSFYILKSICSKCTSFVLVYDNQSSLRRKYRSLIIMCFDFRKFLLCILGSINRPSIPFLVRNLSMMVFLNGPSNFSAFRIRNGVILCNSITVLDVSIQVSGTTLPTKQRQDESITWRIQY